MDNEFHLNILKPNLKKSHKEPIAAKVKTKDQNLQKWEKSTAP